VGSLGIGPVKWFELRTILDALMNSIVDGRKPLIWLLEIYRLFTEEEVIQNQSGTMSDMLVFDISRTVRRFWPLSHVGNLGPRRHDPRIASVRLNGGTQVAFTMMAIEL
jgi:hypothetical protein